MAYVQIYQQPRTTDLTLLATVKTELGLTDTSDDIFIGGGPGNPGLIKQATGAVLKYIDRRLARMEIYEGVTTYDRSVIVTNEMPLVSVVAITQTSQDVDATPTIYDADLYFVSDAEAGFIYNQNGWTTTEIFGFGAWFSSSIEKQPVQANPGIFFADYISGYLLPGDDVIPATGSGAPYAFMASDNSINSSGGVQFPILVPGDVIMISGATSPANSGQFLVVSATPTKVILGGLVSGVLTAGSNVVTEAAPANGFGFAVRNLPNEIERACIETLKGWYFGRDRDWTTKLERIGGTRAGAWQAEYDPAAALPPQAVNLLTPYRRRA